MQLKISLYILIIKPCKNICITEIRPIDTEQVMYNSDPELDCHLQS